MRRTLVKFHLWLGLSLGLFWAIAGLSGALLVFHREMDQATSQLTDGPMASLDMLITNASKYAGKPIQRITAIGPDLRLIEARYDDASGHDMAVRMDAHSGQVIRAIDRDPGTPFGGAAWRWVYIVHTSMLAGTAGKTLIGISGLILVSMLILGITIAWPKGRNWRSVFAVSRWRKRRQHYYGWHKAIGLVLGLLIIVLSLSGAYMTFDAQIADLLKRTGHFETMAAMAHDAPTSAMGNMRMTPISADQVMAITHRQFPRGRFENLETPVEHSEYYSARVTLPEEFRVWSGRAMVRVDAMSGKVVGVYDPTRASWLNKLDDFMYPLHKGEAGGILLRILVLLCGLALPGFFATGVLLWLPKQRK